MATNIMKCRWGRGRGQKHDVFAIRTTGLRKCVCSCYGVTSTGNNAVANALAGHIIRLHNAELRRKQGKA